MKILPRTHKAMRCCVLALGVIVVLLAGTGLQAAELNRPAYLIQAGDALNIQVQDHPEWSLQVTVRPDGRVTYPGLGELQVAGLTLAELTERIVVNLGSGGRHLKNPQVVVNTTSMRLAIVYVLGAVANPGTIDLPTGQETARRVLLMMGGSLPKANLREVAVYRADSTREIINLQTQPDPAVKDVLVRGGDVLVVPEVEERSVGLMGALARTGLFALRPGQDSISLQELVLQIGGLGPNADKERALILRSGGEVAAIPIDAVLRREAPAVQLAAGDVLWVLPEMATQYFVVTGAVGSPGRFEYRIGMTLAEALTLAGQAGEAAQTKEVSLIHKDGSKDVVNIKAMLAGQDPELARLAVQPNDIILVPMQHESYVMLGAVGSPGIKPWEENLRLADALARAGGPVERVANMAHLVLVRRVEGGKKPMVMELNARELLQGKNEVANVVLQIGDTIYIPSVEEKDWRSKLEIPMWLLGIYGTLSNIFR
ncbi:MAG: SLBB domain-containing protein [Armatimonadota bacterium]